MKDEVVIITPEAQPGAGGLADYSLRLVEELRGRAAFRIVVPKDVADLREALPPRDGRVLVQYSAYGFDRRGHPRWLLRELLDWKARAGGLLVVMFHEIWTFRPVLNKDYLVQQLHRHAIGRLLRVADIVFTSTTDQADHLRKLEAERAIQVLPVGSNIPVAVSLDEAREPGLAVLFGLQSSRLRDLRALGDDLKSLAAGVIRKVITCGSVTGDDEANVLRELRFAEGFEQRGRLAPAEISRVMARATYALSAQDPLSLQKSGTFMAHASHALRIVSPHAESLGAEPLCWLVHPRELLEGISEEELQSRAESLRAWQERTASWSEIAARVGEALHLNLP